MPYATLDDVQRRMPQFQLTATSKPSTDSAQVFLDDSHSQIDAALMNLGYVVPITGAMSIPQVREAVCDRSIARILQARGAAIGTDAALQSANEAQKRYDKFLTDLANPKIPIELVDAQRTTDEIRKPGNELAGLLVDEDGEDIEPRISMTSSVFPMRDF